MILLIMALVATLVGSYTQEIVDVYGDSIIMWDTPEGVEIGQQIWGAFAIIQQVENDACAGLHGLQYNAPAPTGFGFY